jgi:uncharacterized membrane protein YdfJ with MMPL/SSD domain
VPFVASVMLAALGSDYNVFPAAASGARIVVLVAAVLGLVARRRR